MTLNTKTLSIGFAILLLGLSIFGMRRCLSDKPSEEQVLLALIDSVATSAEKRDVKAMRPFLSRDYKDDEGRTAKEINALLSYHYLRGGILSVYIAQKDVEVDRLAEPLRATMTVKVVLTRRPKVGKLSQLINSGARALTFSLRLQKNDDRWQLYWANWERVEDLGELLQ